MLHEQIRFGGVPGPADPELVAPCEPMPSAVENALANSVCLIAVCQPVSADIHDLSRTAKTHQFGVVQTREERMLEITRVEEYVKERCDVFDRGQRVQVGNCNANRTVRVTIVVILDFADRGQRGTKHGGLEGRLRAAKPRRAQSTIRRRT